MYMHRIDLKRICLTPVTNTPSSPTCQRSAIAAPLPSRASAVAEEGPRRRFCDKQLSQAGCVVTMAPKMVQHETKKLAIAQHAWSATGSQDSKRYLSFAAGAQIEVVEEREAGGWWAVRFSLLAHALTRARRVPNARACPFGRGAWMASSVGFPSRTARWSMRLRALLRRQHLRHRPIRRCRHRFPIHFNPRRRSPHRHHRRPSRSAPTRSP